MNPGNPVPTPNQSRTPMGPSLPQFQQGTADTMPYDNILQYNNWLSQFPNHQPPKGQVLGASTYRAPGGSTSSNAGNPPVQQSNPVAPQGPQAPQLPSLDSLYQPIFDSFNQTRQQIGNYQNQDLADLLSSYNQNKGLIPGYEQKSRDTLQQNKTNLDQQVQSAYEQAGRNYTLASQNGLNQYGNTGGPVANSPYDAINALSQQELMREQGSIGAQAVQGQQQLNTEGQGITDWVNQQNATLDQQFSEAKDQLNQYFQQQLLSIQNNENATQQEKAQGKIQLIQDVMNQNNQIAQQAMNFKQQLALYNAQLSATGGQNLDMSPFLAQMGVVGSNVNSNTNPANQSYSFLTGNGANQFQGFQPTPKNNNDFVNQVLSGTGAGSTLPVSTQIPASMPGFTNG